MTRFPHAVPACLALALTLAACGGGGSPSGEYRQIGTSPLPVASPTRHTSHGRATVSFDRTPGGHHGQSIVEYLRAVAGGGGRAHEPQYVIATALTTFPAPPTVHLASDTPPEFRDVAADAVANINRWLPYGKRIRIGADVSPLTPIEDVPQGQIFVDFADPAHWRPGGKDFLGVAQWRRINTRTAPQRYSARVWIEPRTRPSLITTTMHELLHALGFSGHISRTHFPETIMGPQSGNSQRVPAIDGETLLAAYTRFDPGTHPDDISQESLGPWATETMHLQGDIDEPDNPIAFGVSFRNGLGHPWARGFKPDTALAGNTALSGSAEWNGALLGFTPAGRTAASAALIGIDLATMTGTADFNDIETWSGAPGARGTGSRWGDLAYLISVAGNAFRNTGGDSGDLKGIFLGKQHQGAAGTLERTDLTAAFGATR